MEAAILRNDIYGMSLRDYFAGQALAGILTNNYTPWSVEVADVTDAQVAEASYELADAMIAAREKAPTP